MKTMDEKLDDSGFEEVQPEEGKTGSAPQKGANRPDINLVQPEVDRDGKTKYTNIGGIWKNISKNGKEFYTVRIGNLRLLGFPNKSGSD